MKKDFGLEFYVYSQLLQVVVHEQMLFVSLEASLFIMNRRQPNEPYFFTIQHKSKVFNNIIAVICDPFQVDLLTVAYHKPFGE
jgi:hypothetical protein